MTRVRYIPGGGGAAVLDANGLPVYGLDAELKKKLDGKWDPAVLQSVYPIGTASPSSSVNRPEGEAVSAGSPWASHCDCAKLVAQRIERAALQLDHSTAYCLVGILRAAARARALQYVCAPARFAMQMEAEACNYISTMTGEAVAAGTLMERCRASPEQEYSAYPSSSHTRQ